MNNEEEERAKEREKKRIRESNINKITCGVFQQSTGEELTTVGTRWKMWLERFKLYVHAKDLEEINVPSYGWPRSI